MAEYGKWSCISHKSLSLSPSSFLLDLAQWREECVVRIRTWSTATNTARSSANVVWQALQRDSSSARNLAGRSTYPSTLLRQDCFCGCVYCIVLSIYFSLCKFIGVWCCTMISELRCTILRKWQLSAFCDLTGDEALAQKNGSARLEQLSLISLIVTDVI